MSLIIDSGLKYELLRYCEEKKIKELYIFGSQALGTSSTESDLDLLVSFENLSQLSMFDFLDIEQDLSKIFSRKVDLVTKNSIERSDNKFLKESILKEAIKIL